MNTTLDKKFIATLGVVLILLSGVVACRPPDIDPEGATPTPVRLTLSPRTKTPTLDVTQTSTPVSPRVVLVIPEGLATFDIQDVEVTVDKLTTGSGMTLQVQSTLSPADFTPETRLVIIFPPDPGLIELVSRAPAIQFLSIGIPELNPAPNLLQIEPQGMRQDQQGFLAGYLAAVITPDYRVGVISTGETPAGRAAREGFLNGVVFFCGLCRPIYPPFVDYPLFVEGPSGSGENPVETLVESLTTNAVQTVYVPSLSVDEQLLAALAGAEVQYVLDHDPPQHLRNHWAATIQPDLVKVLQERWPDLVQGQVGGVLPLSYSLAAVNPALVSPGRQHLVDRVSADLYGGLVDTGVDPQTGDRR